MKREVKWALIHYALAIIFAFLKVYLGLEAAGYATFLSAGSGWGLLVGSARAPP